MYLKMSFSSSFLDDTVVDCRILAWQLLSTLKITFCFLALVVEKLDVSLFVL